MKLITLSDQYEQLTYEIVTRVVIRWDIELAVRLALHEVGRGAEHRVKLHHFLDHLGCHSGQQVRKVGQTWTVGGV